MKMPPADIVEAAFRVGQWAEQNNLKDWEIGPCVSRAATAVRINAYKSLVASKEAQVKHLQAELKDLKCKHLEMDTLQSERDTNAMLTDEIAWLEEEVRKLNRELDQRC